jgi:hypothetical protein
MLAQPTACRNLKVLEEAAMNSLSKGILRATTSCPMGLLIFM